MTDLAIQVSGLHKRFDDVAAVDGLDLEVRRGECFGLLGPNGAGKTTTIEILEGLTEPTSGEVRVLGQRWGGRGDRLLRGRIGVQLQETQLADKLRVEEVVQLFRSFYPDGRGVDEVIALLGLEEKRRAKVHKLSGGQRQRLALACALVSAPELLFLDEPTTGLDPQARHRIWEVIERFRAGGGTTLLTTHYMEEAERLCDRVGIVDRGQLIALGTPEELVAQLKAQEIIELETVPPIQPSWLDTIEGIAELEHRAARLALHVGSVAEVLPAVLRALQDREVEVKQVATHRATLDDVFVLLTGRDLRDG